MELAYAVENQALVSGLYPRATDDALVALVRGHAEVAGPFTLAGFAERLLIAEADVAIAAARLEGEGLLLRGDFSRGSANNGELCDRRLLARIHRMTLDRLRREIEPVSAQDFMRYLFERHHLSPEARSGGRAGLREALGMLQGFELSASSWESDVLARRVAGYKPEWLDELCLSGEAAWLRLSERRASGTTSRATPIALVERKSLGWMLAAVRAVLTPVPGNPTVDAAADAGPRNHSTTVTLEAMKQRGALFFHDLVELTGLGRDELTEALWELVGAGAVTGDGFQPLRDLLRSPRPAKQRSFQGRWSLVELDPSSRTAWEREEVADRVAVQLLARYGVVFRDLVARESFGVPWRDVVRALRRREARGLARGGRFVAGFLGEQFATPDAVDGLRRTRKRARSKERVAIAPADPLNLIGILLPGPREHAGHKGELHFVDGAFVPSSILDVTTAPALDVAL